MLVFSSSLVLTEAEAALPANAPMFLWENGVAFSNITADSEDLPNYPITNAANSATNQEWRAASAADVEITIAVNGEAAAVGIARHNFGSGGISFSVGYYNEDPAWVELTAPQIPANDRPLLAVFTHGSFTDIVIRLTEGDAAARAAVIKCGPVLRMPRGFDLGRDFTPPRFARKSEIVLGMSHRGDYLGEYTTSQWVDSTPFEFKHLDADWYRTYFDPFVAAMRGREAFFFAWAPDEYPSDADYTYFTKDPMPGISPVTARKAVTIELGGITQ